MRRRGGSWPISRALVWLRRDLRLRDNAALAEATSLAEEVVCAFVFDTTILGELPDKDDRRVTFIHRSLVELDGYLRKRGSRLLVLHGDPVEELPRAARALKCERVVAAKDFESAAIARDSKVAAAVELVTVLDHIVQEGGTIRNQSGDPFRVFTPFSRQWRKQVLPEMVAERKPAHPNLVSAYEIDPIVAKWDLADLGFQPGNLWLEAGERAGRALLKEFVARKAANYGELRNFPSGNHTSGLSVHLRFGTVSIRECFRLGWDKSETWINELIWREFYSMILQSFPEVETMTFQPQYRDLVWPGSREHFDAWCTGTTGFPLVDAAMRCLNETGRMHNRLRMVAASFLTKDLLCDYRWGEAYFARKLLDFDLASNNGGWQWAASVGCDAQPYFRVFNPVLQSEKFDPRGEFIRQWCPELRELDDKAIHSPGLLRPTQYPAPIVDHAVQKDKAIALFRSGAIRFRLPEIGGAQRKLEA